jgi:hypothetical protein
MDELMKGFDRFLLQGEQSITMRREFQPVLNGTDLEKNRQVLEVISTYKGVPGIYFWVLRYENAEYKVYIGKTNSLSYRVLNYVSEFQPHSPNDYKLRIFHTFLIELFPTATLDLYFAEKELNSLAQAETDAINRYNPLLNKLPKPTAEAKDELRKAFSLYYRSAFEQKIKQR